MMSCAITNPPLLLLIRCAECPEVGRRRDSSSAGRLRKYKYRDNICSEGGRGLNWPESLNDHPIIPPDNTA